MAERPPASAPPWLVWPFTVLLAAFGGAAVVQAPRKGYDSKAVPVAAENAQFTSPSGESDNFDPLGLIRDYFRFEAERKKDDPILDVRVRAGTTHDGAVQLRIDSNHDKDVARPLPPNFPPFLFEGLIASVPDPVDSKFAYEFDSTVESIQWAFQTRGFILHSSWLPWTRGPDGKVHHDRHKSNPG